MNYGIISRVLGIILIIEAVFMSPSLFIAIFSGGDDRLPFLIGIVITLFFGIILARKKNKSNFISPREGLTIVALAWIVVSIFGALPLYLAKATDTFIDAYFEIMAGFTTTGGSLILDIEILPRGILFWRSFTHWIGGMGILVFTLALLPALGIGGLQIFRAESPGPVSGKVVPRMRDTAKILYIIYFGMTIVQTILLLFGGMDLFEALIYTFGTVGTGGYAIKSTGLASYSPYIHMVIGVFMVLSGISFSLYYSILKGNIKEVVKDEEVRLYLGLILISSLAIGLNLYFSNYGGLGKALKDGFFHVSSMISTTAYATSDFDFWPSFSKAMLLFLMIIGGSAGSTAGGLKIVRLLVVLKLIRREVTKIFHPRAVIPIKINEKPMANETIAGIFSFIGIYILMFFLGTLLISLEGVDLASSAGAVFANISNIGYGLGFVGYGKGFATYSQFSKLVLTFFMVLGRLEFFTLIALFAPKNWRGEI